MPPLMRSIGPRLDMRQSQSLVMTPQLQQAIKLLQLSNLEVVAFVESELEQNPLLERDEQSEEKIAGETATADSREAAPLLDPIEAPAVEGMAASEAPLDADFSNTFDEGPGDGASLIGWGAGGGGGRADFEDPEFGVEQAASRDKTLREHLLEQVAVDLADPADRIIGAHLVHLVDDSGWLTGDLAAVAEAFGCDLARVEATLARLQRFDPPGVFARTLKECLAIQLRERDRLDPAMAALLEHLDLLARRDVAALIKACGVDAEDLTDMVAEIKALDPKPGLAFDPTVAQSIVPDVLMRAAAGGSWIVELNQDTLPRVLVNNRYHARVTKEVRDKRDKEFVAERFQAANWLVKSLHQRAQTILKVATEIVRQQDAFFRRGVQHLKPLVLRDIATAIEMHESTVSRVTTNKYLAAPHGIYELKYFFTSSIADTEGGDAHSAEAVRFRIKTMIDAEKSAEILSDDRLVELLKGDGIDIARRTVAKYRDALRIPSSVQRRREKALGL